MEAQKVDMFIMSNGKFFEAHDLATIREKLTLLDESKWSVLSTIQFKDPTTSLIVSILAGGIGIDRFLIGDTGVGVGKLLTHVIFHPVQKSLNRQIQIDYTVRIQSLTNQLTI